MGSKFEVFMISNESMSIAKQFIERSYSHYVDGNYIEGKGSNSIEIIDPYTEKRLNALVLGTASEMNKAIESSSKAFKVWRHYTPENRQNLLNKFADKLEKNKELLACIEVYCTGKNINIARFEVDQAIRFTRYYAGWATKITGETLSPSIPTLEDESFFAMTKREPVGVVGIITPWNFPIMISLWKIAAALTCGCTVVMKPSEYTPYSALLLAKLAVEAGIPKGVFNVVNGSGKELGVQLIKHPLIAKISFTGSVTTGKGIGVEALKSGLTRFTLELGGKNPAIFCKDISPERVVKAIIDGGFIHQGQICASIERAYIHKSIMTDVIDQLPSALKQLKIGSPFSEKSQFGPLANKAHFEKMEDLFREAQKDCYEIIYGAKVVEGHGYSVEPTVVLSKTPNSRLMTEETFGPLITLYAYEDHEELVNIVNDTPYGLAASVWTDNLSEAIKLTEFVEAGTVWINTHLLMDPSLPFGGIKSSGLGREFGSGFIEDYTN